MRDDHAFCESFEAPPVYEHDCDRCVFLGSFGSKYYSPGDKVDLYFHPKPFRGGMWSVIARWSSEGGDYGSGACFANPTRRCSMADGELEEAGRRAVARGFITQEQLESA